MLFSHNGKSQSSLLIIVFMIALFLIFIFMRIYTSMSYEQRKVTETKLIKLTGYLDMLKGFSREIAILSFHASAKEVAGSGGDDGKFGEVRSWICNNDRKPPTVDEVKYFLGEVTKKFLNDYISKLWIEDLPEVYFSNFTCTDIQVDSTSVFSGENDESCSINNFGSFIEINESEDKVSSANDVSIMVTQLRFWYMYRKFVEWARKTTYPQDVMDCINEMNLGGSTASMMCDAQAPQAFRDCIEFAATKATKELENEFSDPYVKCGYVIGCICIGVTDDCNNVNYPCANCNRMKADKLCIEDVLQGNYQGSKNLVKKSGEASFFSAVNIAKRYLRFAADADIQWCNLYGLCGMPGDLSIWGAVSTTFYCTDTKYALSVS